LGFSLGRGKTYEKVQWRRGPFGAGSRQGERGGQTSLIVKCAQAKVADDRRACPTNTP